MNTQRLIHSAVGRNVAVALVVIGLVAAACVPPPPIIQHPFVSPTPEPAPAEAGVALSTDLAAGESTYHLWSVDAGYAARDYEEFMRSCADKPECLDLLLSPGRVDLALIVPETGPNKLVYSAPTSGIVAPPSAWSNYTLITEPRTGTATTAEKLFLETIPISATVPYTPSLQLGPSIAASLKDLAVPTTEIKQMLLSADTPEGRKHILVVIGPGSGAGCDWVYQACNGCRQCGHEGICRVLVYLCG
jgi:hypothetical protein